MILIMIYLELNQKVKFFLENIYKNFKLVKELNEYHKNHLLPTIDDKIEDEQTIEILTEHITKVIFFL